MNLAPEGAPEGDSASMVKARERFLATGHFDPLREAVVEAAGEGPVGEVGAGTGWYLESFPGAVALDCSKPALRRAARVATAVGADVWNEIPLRDGVLGTLLDVFAPRNGPEMARVIRPGGTLVVVTPTERHLAELPLIGIDPFKEGRLRAKLHEFEFTDRVVEWKMGLSAEQARLLVAMGPSARHGAVGTPGSVTASVTVRRGVRL